jgi:hypothetical protein
MVSIRARQTMAAVALATAALVAGSCAPTPGGGTTTTTSDVPAPPSVTFVIKGGLQTAPAVVALAWTVSDPNGDTLTCSLDADGDGDAETVLEPCTSGSRNVEVAEPTSFTAYLTVEDGNSDPVLRAVNVTVPAGVSETFDIVLRGVDELDEDEAQAFADAEARWESVIVRGVTDLSVVPRPPCLPGDSADLPSVVDDVIIDVAVTSIDGPGNVLGQAGPNCYNTGTELPVHGSMEFDTADVDDLVAEDALDDVVVHEMGHVLGFGTLWDLIAVGGQRKVITGAGTSNPSFLGPRAVAEYSALGVNDNVPLENGGGPGTRDSHWRESTFNNELMTGYINTGSNPLSRLTLASLADMGYQVDLSAADAYSLPGGSASMRTLTRHIASDGVVLRPTPAPI